MTTRISRLFSSRRKALIGYITAGDPSLERTPAIVSALVRGGVDLVELGVPFSDPVADGPVIMRGMERALAGGASLRKVLATASRIRAEHPELPILLFTYMNPVMRYGFEALARDASAAGVDGLLLTDLSIEEAGDYIRVMHASGLDTVFLAAPTSTEERLRRIAECSSGFVYLVSRTGVTGERASVAASAAELATAARAVTDKPLAVGFGISRPEHAAAVARIADGVVIGSAFMRIIEENAPDMESRLEALARELKSAMQES
ncbi:MAG TPA: tryptophan synthase subunit alpha [Bryobacteraceae bacterium]|nr:tryptophan synthase subunit alpha [Bryobacteraceae bacterium]